jgi:hypothetical protein
MSDSLSDTLPDIANLQRLLGQRDAEITRQSAELLARDLLIEKLRLQRKRSSNRICYRAD